MRIRQNRSLEEAKELKVRLPIEQHLRLHSLKVLTGQPISEVVVEALHAYFDEVMGAPNDHVPEPEEPMDALNPAADDT